MTETSRGHARPFAPSAHRGHAGLGPGTGVMTTAGEVRVERLRPGMRIITRDRGAVALSRLIVRTVPGTGILRLCPAALDPDDTAPALRIGAGTRLLLRDWRARILFGKSPVLVPLHRLVDGTHIARAEGAGATRLFQLAFDDGPHIAQIAGGRLEIASARLRAPATA